MSELINSLTGLGVNTTVILVIVFLFWSVLNHKHILELIEYRHKSKLSKLENALNSEHINGLTRSHIEKSLATEHFYLSTGIRAEEELRNTIITEHKNTNGELKFEHYKRAMPHFYFENNKLIVKISKLENVAYWYGLVVGGLVFFIGLILTLVPIPLLFIHLTENSVLLSSVVSGLIFITSGIFILSTSRPTYSAKLVQKEMSKTKNTTT